MSEQEPKYITDPALDEANTSEIDPSASSETTDEKKSMVQEGWVSDPTSTDPRKNVDLAHDQANAMLEERDKAVKAAAAFHRREQDRAAREAAQAAGQITDREYLRQAPEGRPAGLDHNTYTDERGRTVLEVTNPNDPLYNLADADVLDPWEGVPYDEDYPRRLYVDSKDRVYGARSGRSERIRGANRRDVLDRKYDLAVSPEEVHRRAVKVAERSAQLAKAAAEVAEELYFLQQKAKFEAEALIPDRES